MTNLFNGLLQLYLFFFYNSTLLLDVAVISRSPAHSPNSCSTMFVPSSRTNPNSLQPPSPTYPSFSVHNSGVISEHEPITPVSNARTTYFPNPGRRDQPHSHGYTDAYTDPRYLSEPHNSPNTVFSQSYNRGGNNSSQYVYPKSVDTSVASHSRRGDIPLMIDTYNIGVGYAQPSPLTSGVSSSELPKSAGYWSEAEKDNSPQPTRTRKPRREKPRIDLAPDQPPTTQGKPRERVYVACLQW